MEKGEDPLFSAISYPRDMVGKRERFPQRWGRERFSTRFPRGIHREMWEVVLRGCTREGIFRARGRGSLLATVPKVTKKTV